MKSRFSHLKSEAIILRKKGNSIGSIEARLGIPRSTLSYWFRDISLSKSQMRELEKRSEEGLRIARTKASEWHRADKALRLANVAMSAEQMLDSLDVTIPSSAELALAFLYLGEGAKTRDRTTLGSSDPRIARFFIQSLRSIYHVPTENIKCHLHLRADQKPQVAKRYWSKELGLPLSNFGKASIDKRTLGKPTYPHYKGVCLISCGRVEIQRRLMYIANGFCDRIAEIADQGG